MMPDRRSDSPPSVWCPAPGSARLKDSYRAARPTRLDAAFAQGYAMSCVVTNTHMPFVST